MHVFARACSLCSCIHTYIHTCNFACVCVCEFLLNYSHSCKKIASLHCFPFSISSWWLVICETPMIGWFSSGQVIASNCLKLLCSHTCLTFPFLCLLFFTRDIAKKLRQGHLIFLPCIISAAFEGSIAWQHPVNIHSRMMSPPTSQLENPIFNASVHFPCWGILYFDLHAYVGWNC